jgi:hypothetical protein
LVKRSTPFSYFASAEVNSGSPRSRLATMRSSWVRACSKLGSGSGTASSGMGDSLDGPVALQRHGRAQFSLAFSLADVQPPRTKLTSRCPVGQRQATKMLGRRGLRPPYSRDNTPVPSLPLRPSSVAVVGPIWNSDVVLFIAMTAADCHLLSRRLGLQNVIINDRKKRPASVPAPSATAFDRFAKPLNGDAAYLSCRRSTPRSPGRALRPF